jgi:hypothetical protein
MAKQPDLSAGRSKRLVEISLFFLALTLAFVFLPRHDHLGTLRALNPGEDIVPSASLMNKFVTPKSIHTFYFAQDCHAVEQAFAEEVANHRDAFESAHFRDNELALRKTITGAYRGYAKTSPPPQTNCFAIIEVRDPDFGQAEFRSPQGQ